MYEINNNFTFQYCYVTAILIFNGPLRKRKQVSQPKKTILS